MATLSEIAAGISQSQGGDSEYRENIEWFGGEDAGWAMSLFHQWAPNMRACPRLRFRLSA